MPTSRTGRGHQRHAPVPEEGQGYGPDPSQSGFTLLELTIALTLGALLLSAAYASFHAAMAGRDRTQRALEPLMRARYVFASLSRDLLRLHEECTDKDFACEEHSCLFPILDPHGEKIFIRYAFIDGELRRERFAPGERAPDAAAPAATSVVAGNLSQVMFYTHKALLTKDKWFPRLVDLDLDFGRGTQRQERYSHAVYLETTPHDATSN
ncbi:hypothetical protein DFW101_1055 [Solidesulfovibrio carbinoliphilus subsp. oakridgensis]|uniref:Prepilin-type N-terminal cleavage/methylation domain-containing protein n=1 Tax=Solidesulfovibrio carbinoliphilus subsp. oakridgensis TaxID=694327 RepID=G7Q650_9BACT|nr:prepilin-type N-terminal cleavage/methylation domain-containing protein [Solidesulfovibrio carbinoliphilus]EHJ47066.1 hypothetical protein DFW101_1055 [Solidesulfovibrio carbinoliphilus subsp. oakridgensis]